MDEIEELPAHKFFPRARRLQAYKGAFRLRVEEEQEKQKEQRSAPRTPSNKWQKPSRDESSNQGKGTKENPKVYADPKHNIEAAQLGLFESATG